MFFSLKTSKLLLGMAVLCGFTLLTIAPGSIAGAQTGSLSVTETAANQGYALSATSKDTSNDLIPSTAIDTANPGVPGAQTPGTFTNYFTGATSSASSYVEDARQELLFTYTVTNTGTVTLSGVSVTGSLGGLATCTQGNGVNGLGAGGTLSPNGTTTCTATHITTQADIMGAETSQTLKDIGTATGLNPQNTQVTGSDANSPGTFIVPVYGLDSVAAGTVLPNSSSSQILTLNPCPWGTTDESTCIQADLDAISLNNSPLNSKTTGYSGNVAPSAVPVVLDLDGHTYTVNEGTALRYPCRSTDGASGCVTGRTLSSLNPPEPQDDHDTFQYTTPTADEADPGESDIWIENGTLTDPGVGSSFPPVIHTQLGNNIYLSDIEALGNNQAHDNYNDASNAGLLTSGTTNLVLTNFTAFNNHGDGIDLEPFFCGSASADCARTLVTTWNPLTTTVNGVKGPWDGVPADADATESGNGRDGLTPAGTTLSTFDNLVIKSGYTGEINAESDSANTNPGTMTFNTLFLQGMFELDDVGRIGPININGWVSLAYAGGGYSDAALWVPANGLNNPWAGSVTVTNSELACSGYTEGEYTACIIGDNVAATSGNVTSCGDTTPFAPGDGWLDFQQGGSCNPGIIVDTSSINITKFVRAQNRRIADGLWNQFNEDCVIDTGVPPNGVKTQGVVANSNGNQYAQIIDNGTTFSPGSVCATLLANPPAGDVVEALAQSSGAYGVNLTHDAVGTINPTPVGTSTFTVGIAAPCSPEGAATAFQATTAGTWAPALTAGDMSVYDPYDLPAGMSAQDNGDGTLTVCGTPTTLGTNTFTVEADNGSGNPVFQSFTITVN